MKSTGGTARIAQWIDTLQILVERDFRIRYKGSVLGIGWALLTPLGTVLVLDFVFSEVLPVGVPDFPVFLYTGLLPWVWLASTVQGASLTLIQNRDLVQTPFVGKPLIAAIGICTNFILYLLSLPVLFYLMFVNGIPFSPSLAALPLIWLVEAIIILALTLFVAGVAVVVRDTPHLLTVVMSLWFYATPIFYELAQVPAAPRRWFAFNPMTAVVTAHRDVTMHGRLPGNWLELGTWSLAGMLLAAVSLVIFNRVEDVIVDQT